MSYVLLGAASGAVLLGSVALLLRAWASATAPFGGGDIGLLVAVGAIAGALLARAWRPVTVERAIEWAARRDAEGLGEDAVALLQRFIRRSSGWRTTAVVAPVVCSVVAVAVVNASGGTGTRIGGVALTFSDRLGFTTAALLYAVAAIAVELTRSSGPGGAAVLSARDPADYLSPFASWVQRFVIIVPVVMVGLTWAASGVSPGVSVAVTLAGLAALAIVVELAQRRLIGRAQRWRDRDVIVADDLARASTAHALTGGFAGSVLMIAGDLTGYLPSTVSRGGIVGLVSFVGALLGIAGLGLWAGFGTEYASAVTRRVPRDRPSGATAPEVGA